MSLPLVCTSPPGRSRYSPLTSAEEQPNRPLQSSIFSKSTQNYMGTFGQFFLSKLPKKIAAKRRKEFHFGGGSSGGSGSGPGFDRRWVREVVEMGVGGFGKRGNTLLQHGRRFLPPSPNGKVIWARFGQRFGKDVSHSKWLGEAFPLAKPSTCLGSRQTLRPE